MIKKILLIDDCREGNFVIARTYEAGIFLLQSCSWDLLLLDHDLDSYVDGKEMTGYDVMCWLEQFPVHLPKRIELVTSNPAGRKRMQQVIDKLYADPQRGFKTNW